jgi:hypothetical protein
MVLKPVHIQSENYTQYRKRLTILWTILQEWCNALRVNRSSGSCLDSGCFGGAMRNWVDLKLEGATVPKITVV